MQLTFLGANRQVTGSRYCLEVNHAHVMIDCGLFQEREFLERNWDPCPIPAGTIKALLLTHVHIDHSGLIPKLVREGFKGKIFATHPTVDLADVVLRDSARIQEEDAEYKRKRHRKEGRQGKHPEVPLYRTSDVDKALKAFRGVQYDQAIEVAEGISVRFRDAGHILGSAMLEIEAEENGTTRKIIFSGDIGQHDKPLICDPWEFRHADYVVMESTYGNRDHDPAGDVESLLCEVIQRTVSRGGNVVIPTFAIERAQELLYHISRLVYAERIPRVPVFLDSPMAVDVTGIFDRNQEYLDRETLELISSGEPPLSYPGLHLVQTVQDSKGINDVGAPCVILSPSGMCNAGRVKHHLRHNISRPESTILFVGYQAHGTLGRQILDGMRTVRIHGREHNVAAEVTRIEGLSAHADRAGLLRWLSGLESPPKQVFLTHGEEDAAMALRDEIRNMGWSAKVPEYGETVVLE